MYYCNINGLLSKKESLSLIVDKLQPKIIVLCETKLAANNVIKNMLPDYEVSTRPTKAGKRGLAICVRKQTFLMVLDVTSSTLNDILTVRIVMKDTAIRVILGYAPQETEDAEVRENFYEELKLEIIKCRIVNDIPVVLGDMNAKIRKRETPIQNNPNTTTTNIETQLIHTSPNGKLLLNMTTDQDLDILNFHKNCSGKLTHVIRTTGAASVLDYVMSCHEITSCVDKIIIDEDCIFCPFHLKKKEPQFSDHNAIITRFKIKHQKKKYIPISKWRITHHGLEKFHEITCTELDTTLPNNNVQECYDIVEKRINAVMDKCFRKIKEKKVVGVQESNLDQYHQIMKFARKGKAQRNVAATYIKELVKINCEKTAAATKQNIVNIVKKLTIDNNFSPDNFWKVCKKSRGQSSNIASVETAEGVELYGEDLILNAYRDEFKHRLRKREIIPELVHYETQTEQICEVYLNEARKVKEPNYSNEELQAVRKELKAGKACGRDLLPPEIFMKGGDKLNSLLLSMLNMIRESDDIPEQWKEVLITVIFKNKGKRKQLVNYRGIFLKQILSKMFEKLNMNRIKGNTEKIDKFQAGSTSNRSPADQTFMLRAAVDHAVYLNRPLYITVYDFSQCFDSLWLADSLLSLWKLGVRSETLSNISKMNETCKIVVKTPIGLTEETTVTSIVQQGSVSGGVLCSASTAEVTQENLGKGCQIGLSNIRALAFVDDIAACNTEIPDVYQSHSKITWFSDKKRLPLNIPKCMLLAINATEVIPRLKINEVLLKIVERAIYLGDTFNKDGSNTDLITDRVTKGNTCIINAITLCDEVTLGTFTVQTLLLLYKCLYIAVVLYNSQAWSKLTADNISVLQTNQLKFLKRIFHVPKSTPNAITFLETGTLPIKQEIDVRRLNFLHHILTLGEEDPVNITYKQLLRYKFEPNWANDIRDIRQVYELVQTDEEIAAMTKEAWKRIVKRRIRHHALQQLNDELAKLKIGDKIGPYSELKRRDYLNCLPPHEARSIFQLRSGVIDTKCTRKYWYDDRICRVCHLKDEDVDHLVNECPGISRKHTINNLFTEDVNDLKEISARLVQFEKLVSKNQ